MLFKPMLASPADLARLKFPLLASPKLDGVRASVVSGRLLTRKLKEVPNRYTFTCLSSHTFDGMDGELIVGPPNAEDVLRQTTSAIMSRDGAPQFTYWVFDLHDSDADYESRRNLLYDLVAGLDDKMRSVIHLVPQVTVRSMEELLEYEAGVIEDGYEGVMLRDPHSPYKYGRSTTREGYLLKLKRFEDSEAEVIGIEEEMQNNNVAMTNELGLTKRSTAKAGLTGKGTMGALVVRDLKTGVTFNIGSGFTAADRQRTDWIGKIVKYKFFAVGIKDKPRHPVFLGERDARDMS